MTREALVDELVEAARALLSGVEGAIGLALKAYVSSLKLIRQLVEVQLSLLEELGVKVEEARREKVKVE
ncbi:MAG: hypothetical protein DRJ97_05775 [Thermoprotei archaeon]|nr:MAG: hypothetical protein DRJ97_05775 [Thermoprotei archaeon]